jgi:hypothetical protein
MHDAKPSKYGDIAKTGKLHNSAEESQDIGIVPMQEPQHISPYCAVTQV